MTTAKNKSYMTEQAKDYHNVLRSTDPELIDHPASAASERQRQQAASVPAKKPQQAGQSFKSAQMS